MKQRHSYVSEAVGVALLRAALGYGFTGVLAQS